MILFKNFIKCIPQKTKIWPYGWLNESEVKTFEARSTPKYYMNLPVKYFHFRDDGVLKVRFGLQYEAFNNGNR